MNILQLIAGVLAVLLTGTIIAVAAYLAAVVVLIADEVIEEAAALARMVSRSLNRAPDIAVHPQYDGSPS